MYDLLLYSPRLSSEENVTLKGIWDPVKSCPNLSESVRIGLILIGCEIEFDMYTNKLKM